MATETLTGVLRYVRHLTSAKECDEQSDSQLLLQFVGRRDEAAFAALLQRHGPLVFAVCRQVLREAHDAEDAFQATFLVLARKAASIRKRESLAAWLHKVAFNIAWTVKTSTSQRQANERQAISMSQTNLVDEVALRDLQTLIHEEVDLLAEKYRVPIVLCYLEGKTHEVAARQLGWPLGTVKGRLARARDLLRTRLVRRGLTLSGGTLATVLTQSAASGHVSAALLGQTLSAAVSFAAGGTIPAGTASAQAVTLAQGALPAIPGAKLLAVLVMIVGAALAATYSLVAGLSVDRQEIRALVPDQPAEKPQALADPLPPGAIARMGTPRFRHGGPVRSMAYLANGKVLATGGYIGTRRETGIGRIRLWEVATGKELRQFKLQGSAYVAGSPDGKILAGADETDGIVYLWEAATGKEIHRLKGRQSGNAGILPMAFSGDGKKLATGGHEVRVWDVQTGKLLHSARGEEPVEHLAFSADSTVLAVMYIDLVPSRRFQVEPWKELAPLQPKRDVELLAFSPDKKALAVTARGSGSIFLHDSTDGTEFREIRAHQVRDPLRPAKFWLTPEEAREMEPGQVLDVLGQKRITALAFALDGKTLASAASDKAIRLWDVATLKERQALSADSFATGSLAFAPDGKSLAWANSAGVIRIWDLRTGQPTHRHDGHQGVVTSVALTPDGKTLITGGADATIRFWETASAKELRRFEGHLGPIASIHLSKDGTKLASVSPADRTVRVWEMSTGKELRRFRASTTYCDAAWLPDSRTLVVRRYLGDSTVSFCDIATGKEAVKIENVEPRDGMNYPDNVEGAHQGGALAVSPDGKMLLTNVHFSGGGLHLWDVATGKKLPGIPPDHHNRVIVKCVVFSPDSKALIKTRSQYESTIHVWDMAARKERQHFGGHFKVKDPDGDEVEVPTYLAITYLAISPNGKTLAGAAGDQTIRLWDVDTGKERRLEGHRGTVTSLAWSADGKTLVSGSNDGTALVWDMTN